MATKALAVHHNGMVPYSHTELAEIATTRETSDLKVSPAIQRKAKVGALKANFIDAATASVNQREAEAQERLIAGAVQARDQQLAILAADSLSPELREETETAIHNVYVAQLRRTTVVSEAYHNLLSELLEALDYADLDWSRYSFWERVDDLFGERELKERYGITLSLKQSILNTIFPRLVAEYEMRKEERRQEQGNRTRRHG